MAKSVNGKDKAEYVKMLNDLNVEHARIAQQIKDTQHILSEQFGWDANPDGSYQGVYKEKYPARRFHLVASQVATMLVGRELADSDTNILRSGQWIEETDKVVVAEKAGKSSAATIRSAISYLDRARLIEQAPSIGGREVRYQLTDLYLDVCEALDRDLSNHSLRPFGRPEGVDATRLMALARDDYEELDASEQTDVASAKAVNAEAGNDTEDEGGDNEDDETVEDEEPTPAPKAAPARRARRNLI